MKTLAAAATLFYLCAPALADTSPPAPEGRKVHFALQEAGTQTFDVILGRTGTCATVNQKMGSREVELSVCGAGEGTLDIAWRTRSGSSEYQSRSSIPATRGTSQLGSAPGPRLEVTVQ